MYFFTLMILTIILVIQINKNDKLQKEIFKLKNELKKYQSTTDFAITPSTDSTISTNNTIPSNTSNNAQANLHTLKTTKKEKMDSQASKNLSVLITGSILIVLAAIVFLTSTWQSIPNILKTLILFLLAAVFLGASKISKEKFHLEKASQTFFYIAMAYLPICLISISFFGLLGEFLSITGAGKYLYLGFSALILAILYYVISQKQKDHYLVYGSVLSQLLAIILITLMFEERIFLVFINILLYNILLMLLTKQKIFKDIYKIIPLLIGVLAIVGLYQKSLYSILTCILLVVNFIGLYIKENSILNGFGVNFYLFAFGFSIILKDSFNLSNGMIELLSVLYVSVAFILENFLLISYPKSKNLKFSLRILAIFSMLCIYISSIFTTNTIIPSYLVGILFILLNLFCFGTTKNRTYKYITYIFLNILLYDINYKLFDNSNLKDYIPMLSTFMIMYFEKKYPKLNDTVSNIYLCIIETITLLSVGATHSEVNTILCILFTIAIFIYNYKNKISEYFNIAPMFCVLPSILESNLSDEFEIVILLISSMALTLLSLTPKKINVYTFFSGLYFIIACSEINNNYLTNIILIAWSTAHIYFLANSKEKDIFKVLTYILSSTLYYLICQQLKLDNYTIFKMLGIIVAGMLIVKSVLAKYIQTDTLEYVFWGFVYLAAIANYADSTDGIIFSIFIVATIFYSYNQKYGATFLCGILAIIANGFLLTRHFWLIIPWWIYLLAIGGSLIAFGIKNEANENKLSIGNVLKNIKNSCEKIDKK